MKEKAASKKEWYFHEYKEYKRTTIKVLKRMQWKHCNQMKWNEMYSMNKRVQKDKKFFIILKFKETF